MCPAVILLATGNQACANFEDCNIKGAMRNCNKIVTEKSIISLGDLDPSDLKLHQKVEVHERSEKSIISLGDLDPSDLNLHQKVEVHERLPNI
ncbi:hypothetical protein DPMN_033229 [Dreissena polymorpha]|uniref:Uncharacterized protein n=1 Tax=Dreissena polymorpha TaxID=45954 RepID=A0A9D4M3E8_DREPO|nr:hypothetical protein DPMN_033229 [Dreissena polymorpha]